MPATEQQRWEKCLKFFEENLNEAQYEAWFKPLSLHSYKDGKLTLNVPSSLFMEMLEGRYMRLLKTAIKQSFGEETKLFYFAEQVAGDAGSAVTFATAEMSTGVTPGAGAVSNPFYKRPAREIDPQLNPRYNFENYIQGQSNMLARSIGEAIGNDPRNMTFNPLFVFGPTGVGKTHLIQAIGIRIKEKNPQANVLYVTARLFESQYTTATNGGRINDFMRFYQGIDTLILDDIQDLRGNKEKTQNALFHIFNHLHLNQRQLILSSDCCPSSLEGLQERLLSRFKWGMTVELEKPDLKLRHDILERRARQDGLDLQPEIIDYIAANVTESVRELEGVVVSLLAHATVMRRDIDLDLTRLVVANAVRRARNTLNFEIVARKVSEYYKLDPDLIFSSTRKRDISDARQMVMYLAKKHVKMPLTAIGNRLGRTHATVLHACRSIEERLPVERQLRTDVSAIEASLHSDV